jgi:hypothetical protein
MKIVTFHYDDGKATAMVKPDDFEGQTGSTEKYDMYVETLDDSGSGVVGALGLWIDNSLIVKTAKQRETILRSLFMLKVVDISKHI